MSRKTNNDFHEAMESLRNFQEQNIRDAWNKLISIGLERKEIDKLKNGQLDEIELLLLSEREKQLEISEILAKSILGSEELGDENLIEKYSK